MYVCGSVNPCEFDYLKNYSNASNPSVFCFLFIPLFFMFDCYHQSTINSYNFDKFVLIRTKYTDIIDCRFRRLK